MVTKTCTNKGCGKSFKESDNSSDSCRYHPAAPVFHEGMKGWACCSKRVISFDEFLDIAGCQVGPHSDKPEQDAEPERSEAPAAVGKKDAGVVLRDGVEYYGAAKPTAPNASKPAVKAQPQFNEVEDNDPEDVIVPAEEKCKRSGCGYKFVSNDISRNEGSEASCTYHPGKPVFHEGSKGWSCCSRKVLEFDEFLKIRGCRNGKHLFVGTKRQEYVQCRNDWFQSPTTITISIYAKKVDPAGVKIEFSLDRMEIDFTLPNGQKYRWHTDLFQSIDTEKSKYEVLGTKIEIVLKKTNGISWPSVEPSSGVKTWTTFGIHGKTGTVGSKEMLLSQDAPLFALDK